MNHFHFGSENVNDTVSFYTRYFGFKKIKELGKTHVLKNDVGFILAIDETTKATSIPVTSHLGFTLKEKDDVEDLYVRMQSTVKELSPLQSPSERALHFYCADPVGNKIEVGWYQF